MTVMIKYDIFRDRFYVNVKSERNTRMKKRNVKKVMVLSLVGVMGMSALSGCGKKDKKDDSATKIVAYEVNDYVTALGTYKGLTVDEKITIVTDEDIQDSIDSIVSQKTTYSEVSDRNSIETDRLTIDYIKAVEGLEDVAKNDYQLELGKASISKEFDEKLLGAKVGAKLEFTLEETSIDKDEETGENKTSTINAKYTVSVKKIEQKNVPEVTDQFIKDNSDYATVDEYKAETRKSMEKTNAESATSTAKSDLIQMVIDESTVTGCPTFLYNLNYNAICQSYASYATYFGYDLDGYLSMAGSSLEELQKTAVDMTKQTLVIEAIAKDAGIEVTEEELDSEIQKYIDESSNFNSKEDVLKQYSKEEITYDLRKDKVADYLYENNTVNKKMVAAEE